MYGQIREKRLDLPFPLRQVLPAAHMVKMDIALDPVNIRPLRMDRVVAKAQDVADLVQYFSRFWLTFHIHLLIFQRESDPDIGPGTFDLEIR